MTIQEAIKTDKPFRVKAITMNYGWFIMCENGNVVNLLNGNKRPLEKWEIMSEKWEIKQ